MLTHDPAAQFSVAVEDFGTTRTVCPEGEIDVASAPSVAVPLMRGLANGFESVVLDLGGVRFIDSTGIALVVGAADLARERERTFVVIPGPPDVQRVFDLCGLADVVPFARPRRFRGGGAGAE